MPIKSNTSSKFAIIFLLILTLFAVYLIRENYTLTKNEIDNFIREQDVISNKITEKFSQQRALYEINEGNGKIISSELNISKDSTVFSLLEDLSLKENFKVESKEYKEMGVFVESIDGIKNGTDNKYWQYWVNGELPMVAADKKEVKKGDNIEWKFAPAEF